MIVTPYLVKPMDPTKKVRTPADQTYPASTVDYFLGNQDETKARGSGALAYASPTQPAAPAPTSGHFLDLPME
jgi:pilus assembly protein CpaC